jgi:hypothetical protein
MKRLRTALILSCGVLAALSIPDAHGRDRYGETETRSLRETIPLEPGEDLLVDIVYGSITVTGTGGSEVRMVAVETIEGRNRERVERARREVSLEVHRTAEGVLICQDGPFRDPDDCTEWRNDRRMKPRYRVSYDIELQVPREVALDVHTVEGDIDVTGVRGSFAVFGVNGGIEMSEIVGSGTARTVNGPVRVRFLENPREDSSFETVNGEIDVAFQAGLSADLRFKTMNGEVLSDFDYRMLPPEPVTQKSRHGRTIYKMSGRSGIRIASGGPRFFFENINGDILVRKGR